MKTKSHTTKRAFDFKWNVKSTDKIPVSRTIHTTSGSVEVKGLISTREDKYINILLNHTKIERDWFKGKSCLDVGCGFGEFSYALAKLHARSVDAFDVSEKSIEITSNALRKFKNVNIFLADLTKVTFEPKYDFVMAWGVLHHTPNTLFSFRNISKAVKPGGYLFVHLYERSNPLRRILTNYLRGILHLLPVEKQYKICTKYLTIKNKILLKIISKIIIVGDKEIGVFDAYSPKYNHTHTAKEVVGWFKEAGFENIEIINPRLNKTLIKRFISGEYGGALYVKGQKNNT